MLVHSLLNLTADASNTSACHAVLGTKHLLVVLLHLPEWTRAAGNQMFAVHTEADKPPDKQGATSGTVYSSMQLVGRFCASATEPLTQSGSKRLVPSPGFQVPNASRPA